MVLNKGADPGCFRVEEWGWGYIYIYAIIVTSFSFLVLATQSTPVNMRVHMTKMPVFIICLNHGIKGFILSLLHSILSILASRF